MKEIKFRAYDKKEKKIYQVVGLDWIVDGTLMVTLLRGENLEVKAKDLELLEYTGLKDKKRTKEFPEGQEIYEGDVLKEKHPKHYDADYSLYRVKFGDFDVGSGDYEDPHYDLLGWYIEGYIKFKKKEHGKDERWTSYGYEHLKKFLKTLLVIGNIWEDKDLLK